MARPRKVGLDYFPLNVNAGVDDELELLEADFGLEGFAVYVKLLQMIYKNGYYIRWNETEQLRLKKRVNLSRDKINELIDACLKWRLFSKRVFEEHRVLTSHGIQQRFLLAIGRRKDVDIEKAYLLLTKKEIAESKVKINLVDNLLIEKGKEEVDKDETAQEVKSEISNEQQELIYRITQIMQDEYGLFKNDIKADIEMCVAEDMSYELFKEAISLKNAKEKHNVYYTMSILRNWMKKGFKTPSDLEDDSKHENNQRGSGQSGIERSSAELRQMGYKSDPSDSEEVHF